MEKIISAIAEQYYADEELGCEMIRNLIDRVYIKAASNGFTDSDVRVIQDMNRALIEMARYDTKERSCCEWDQYMSDILLAVYDATRPYIEKNKEFEWAFVNFCTALAETFIQEDEELTCKYIEEGLQHAVSVWRNDGDKIIHYHELIKTLVKLATLLNAVDEIEYDAAWKDKLTFISMEIVNLASARISETHEPDIMADIAFILSRHIYLHFVPSTPELFNRAVDIIEELAKNDLEQYKQSVLDVLRDVSTSAYIYIIRKDGNDVVLEKMSKLLVRTYNMLGYIAHQDDSWQGEYEAVGKYITECESMDEYGRFLRTATRQMHFDELDKLIDGIFDVKGGA